MHIKRDTCDEDENIFKSFEIRETSCIFKTLTTNVPYDPNQTINLNSKSIDWFLYNGEIGR